MEYSLHACGDSSPADFCLRKTRNGCRQRLATRWLNAILKPVLKMCGPRYSPPSREEKGLRLRRPENVSALADPAFVVYLAASVPGWGASRLRVGNHPGRDNPKIVYTVRQVSGRLEDSRSEAAAAGGV